MSRVSFTLLAATLTALAAVGCKGETKDSPQTLAKLSDCETRAAKLADKDKLIQSYEAEIARLKLASGNQEYTFAIDGDALVIKAKPQGGGGAAPVDDKLAAELSQQFLGVVNGSRGPIQKCYEQALKKNSGLQARTISLRVSASFSAGGEHVRSSFSPALGDAFDGCMKSVASRWKLKPASQGMTFQATVSLSPS
ncbi:MAG TPA: hypothetical protein VM734_33450 [Kofleriaceae bacterium]|jgi:hypothetical protein|nr:hypothetical protein [Kofleriaceae bacterium]